MNCISDILMNICALVNGDGGCCNRIKMKRTKTQTYFRVLIQFEISNSESGRNVLDIDF